jgi:alpha-tubulin suppressor-like RCC1 family protein
MNHILKKSLCTLIFFLYFSVIHSQCTEKIAAGAYHTVFINSDGTLWQRGLFYHTYFTPEGVITPYIHQLPVQLGTDSDWMDVKAGWFNSIALKNDNTLWRWAADELPHQIGNDSNWESISMGDYNCIALKTDGTLWKWTTSTEPIQIGTDTDWQEADCGLGHYLAIKVNGTLWAWGSNQAGQVGDGTFVYKPYPVQIGVDNDWLSISGGGSHSLAIKDDHTLWTWGEDNKGQLGYFTPNYENQTVPRLMNSDNNWNFILASGDNSVGIKEDNSMWVWGCSYWGALANNASTSDILIPIMVGSGPWNSVIGQYYTFMAIKSNGDTWQWGRNIEGQLGTGPSVKNLVEQMDCSLLSTPENNLSMFSVYPNPVHDILTIEQLNGEIGYIITISDLTGKKIFKNPVQSSKVNLTSLCPGLYLLHLEGQNGDNQYFKIIKK